MKAMIVKAYGNSDVFEEAEIKTPSIKLGHVLVKVAATSVNTVDTMIRQMGQDLPLSPTLPALLGMDFAGTIEEVGDDVNDFNVGDEVYGCAGGLADLPGALAEFILADSKLIAHKPKTISMREAAALPLVGITAYEGLIRAGITKGQKVLVHGGSGGVGHVALQLAKYFGADVYSTGGGEAQLKLIESLAGKGINYRSEPVADYVERCTNGNGLINYNIATHETTIYKTDGNSAYKIGSNSIEDVLVDKSRNIWMATTGNGLNKFNLKNLYLYSNKV